MIEQYIEINQLLRGIREKSYDVSEKLAVGDTSAVKIINGYIQRDYNRLERVWQDIDSSIFLGDLKRHIRFGEAHDYKQILFEDIPQIEEILDKKLRDGITQDKNCFKKLLHPIIKKNAYHLYENVDYRNAVLDSITGIFDLIREKTGLDGDGAKLVNKALAPSDPYLVLSNLDTESGRNDQNGFIQIFQGAYLGIRNPKAHTLGHDLTKEKTEQYLIFASLLARRIDEARVIKKD